MEPEFQIKWSGYESAFAQNLTEAREAHQFTDVTICTIDATVFAHKLVLACSSAFFGDLLSRHPISSPVVVVLKDAIGAELELLLEYIYRGSVDCPQRLLKGMISLAHSLRVKGLCDLSGDVPSPQPQNQPPKERPVAASVRRTAAELTSKRESVPLALTTGPTTGRSLDSRVKGYDRCSSCHHKPGGITVGSPLEMEHTVAQRRAISMDFPSVSVASPPPRSASMSRLSSAPAFQPIAPLPPTPSTPVCEYRLVPLTTQPGKLLTLKNSSLVAVPITSGGAVVSESPCIPVTVTSSPRSHPPPKAPSSPQASPMVAQPPPPTSPSPPVSYSLKPHGGLKRQRVSDPGPCPPSPPSASRRKLFRQSAISKRDDGPTDLSPSANRPPSQQTSLPSSRPHAPLIVVTPDEEEKKHPVAKAIARKSSILSSYRRDEEEKESHSTAPVPSVPPQGPAPLPNSSPPNSIRRSLSSPSPGDGGAPLSLVTGQFEEEDPPPMEAEREPPLRDREHVPEARSTAPVGCDFCWKKEDFGKSGLTRRKTRYQCLACGVNLCIVPCFQEYHSRLNSRDSDEKRLSHGLTGSLTTANLLGIPKHEYLSKTSSI